MIASPGILASIARRAEIAVPDDLDAYEPDAYPHFHVFMIVQLGAPMPWADVAHENAALIAKLPVSDLKKMTFEDFVARGIR